MRRPHWLVDFKQKWRDHKNQQRATAFDIALFLRQFATLINAGIPIIKTCEMLEKSQDKLVLQKIIATIKLDILAGKNLFSSLMLHKRYFDYLTCQLIKIGEHTGKLELVLNMIATQKEQALAFKKRMQQALVYPAIITSTALIVTLCMFLFVIPRFAELFQDTQVKLPSLTVWIFALAAHIKTCLLIVVLALMFSTLFILYHPKAKQWQHHLRRYMIKLPIIHTWLSKITLANFARHLAITFTAGIPIHEALRLIAPTSGNLESTQAITQLYHKICAGLLLHHAMQTQPYFPSLMVQMVKVGEESGMLEEMLNKVADFYEADVNRMLCHCSQLLEPLIILILGALIGVVVIGMYLPIFKLGTAF